MMESKGGEEATTSTIECCMCGDYGLSYELFRCKFCQIRSQHRYCSNQYPRAESYEVCNWCLSGQKVDSAPDKTQNSSNSSSSYRKSTDDDQAIKDKDRSNGSDRCLRERRRGSQLQTPAVNGGPVKKLERSSPEKSLGGRKRIIIKGSGIVEERNNHVVLRKSKSENQISNVGGGGGIIKTRQAFRNKVRRYKLLEEVSS